jgi:hypothetical protein
MNTVQHFVQLTTFGKMTLGQMTIDPTTFTLIGGQIIR